MIVNTDRVARRSLAARKTVELADKRIQTPAKSLQAGKMRGSDAVCTEARGVVEIYATANSADLDRSRSGASVLDDRLEKQAKAAKGDEIVVAFVQYDDTNLLSKENAKEMARVQATHADVIVTPLMHEIWRGVENGDSPSSTHAAMIIENTVTYLEAVDELGVEGRVMGAVPPVSADVTQALMTEFLERNLMGYCGDFNRRTFMAQFQIENLILPMMGMLRRAGRLDSVLTYAINAKFSRKTEDGNRTPDVLYGFAAGFDIVGDVHIPPRLPEEVLEEIRGGPVELRLFDADSVSVVEVHIDDLGSFLPGRSKMPVGRVKHRIGEDQNEQYRYTKLLNAGLLSIFLVHQVGANLGRILAGIISGEGVKEQDLERLEELVRAVRGI